MVMKTSSSLWAIVKTFEIFSIVLFVPIVNSTPKGTIATAAAVQYSGVILGIHGPTILSSRVKFLEFTRSVSSLQ